jgi:DNA-binding NtrC family response regulator
VWAGVQRGTREFELKPGEELLIGSGSDVQMRLADPTVSRLHCRVAATTRGLEVVDLNSTNGICVAGVRVASALVSNSGPAFVVGRTPIYVRAMAPERGDGGLPGMVGVSEGIRRVAKEVRCFAPHDVAVLIQGETGSGKDVVARAIHELSGRKGPFIAVNIGALQDSLADAELFGHRKGAFTGAVTDRRGAFELAHGGTLFLDEIGDISPAVQVKLLRALEEKRIRALGSEREVTVDVRIVAASWAELDALASEGRFRWDLYHRLSTAIIRVPALRERRADIPVLARHFLRVDAVLSRPYELTDDAVERLKQHEWQGNIRELRAALKRGAMLCPNGVITSAELDLKTSTATLKPERRQLTGSEAVALLREHSGNVSAAARAAGLPRSTFRNALASHRGPTELLVRAS